MIKMDNETDIYNAIHKAICQTITEHGPIHSNGKSKYLVKSATKRILGAIKTQLYNSKIQKVKRMRTKDGYENVRIELSQGIGKFCLTKGE